MTPSLKSTRGPNAWRWRAKKSKRKRRTLDCKFQSFRRKTSRKSTDQKFLLLRSRKLIKQKRWTIQFAISLSLKIKSNASKLIWKMKKDSKKWKYLTVTQAMRTKKEMKNKNQKKIITIRVKRARKMIWKLRWSMLPNKKLMMTFWRNSLVLSRRNKQSNPHSSWKINLSLSTGMMFQNRIRQWWKAKFIVICFQ